ncbi:MAG TPA: hypothetical protein VMT30_01340 [Candidatus Saccharimonadia bacterium]|nr:hypothetical protein [Candidatus Saccharimonadia bacterium]
MTTTVQRRSGGIKVFRWIIFALVFLPIVISIVPSKEKPPRLRIVASMIGADYRGYTREVTINRDIDNIKVDSFSPIKRHDDYTPSTPKKFPNEIYDLKYVLRPTAELTDAGLIICTVQAFIDGKWTNTPFHDNRHGPSTEGVTCHVQVIDGQVVAGHD